jgi:hypothetical protein
LPIKAQRPTLYCTGESRRQLGNPL